MQTDAFKISFIVLKRNFKYLNHRVVVVNLKNQRLIIIHMRLFFSSSTKSKKINKVMGNAVNLNIILWILIWLNAYICIRHLKSHSRPPYLFDLYLFVCFFMIWLFCLHWILTLTSEFKHSTALFALHNVNWWTREKDVVLFWMCNMCFQWKQFSSIFHTVPLNLLPSAFISNENIVHESLISFDLFFRWCFIFKIKLAIFFLVPNCIIISLNRSSKSMQ